MIYAIKKYKDKIEYIILFFGIIIYFWAMSFLAIPILRYVIPAMPFVIIFSAAGVSFILIKLREKLNFKR